MNLQDTIQDNTLDIANALERAAQAGELLISVDQDVIILNVLGVMEIKLTNNLKNGGDNWVVNTF